VSAPSTEAASTAAAERPARDLATLGGKAGWLLDRWRPHRRILGLLAFLTLVSTGVTVAYPLALKSALDEVQRAAQARETAHVGFIALVLGLTALGRFVSGFYPAFRAWLNTKLEADIRAEAFARVLEKDHTFPVRFKTGDVVTRLTDDVSSDFMKLGWFCCSGIFRAIDSSSRIFFALLTMLLLEPRLAVASMAPLPLMLVLFYAVQRRLAEGVKRQQEAISRTSELLEAAFTGIKIVKAFSAEEGQRRKLAAVLTERIPLQLAVVKLFLLFESAEALAARAGQVVALAYGGYLVAAGEVSLGTVYAIFMVLDLIVAPMQDLPKLLLIGKSAFVSVDRVEELRNAPALDAGSLGGAPGHAPLERIEALSLEGVDFAHEGSKAPALAGVSLGARRGERVAVVGAVGAGKSTLLKVLAGLLPPSGGRVLVDGRPAVDPGWRAVRARLGYVPQDAQLFAESIAGNVGLDRAPLTEIDAAVRAAQLGPDLERLPAGLDTVLGERGSRISGGQRQRVAIARALARRPDVLLLDDATAALDAASEDRFWDALDRERSDLAVVVTTHRSATVRRAHRVVILERGRIVEEGLPAELLARSPRLRELLATDEGGT